MVDDVHHFLKVKRGRLNSPLRIPTAKGVNSLADRLFGGFQMLLEASSSTD